MRLPLLCLLALGCGCAAQYLPEHWPRMGTETAPFVWDEAWNQEPWSSDFGVTHGGMAVDASGRIYVSRDTAPAMVVFDQKGRQLETWGEDLGGGLHGFTLVEQKGVEVLYLAHTSRHQVLRTDLRGTVLATYDYPEASGLYENQDRFLPTSVAVAADGNFYIADGYGLGYVHRYSPDGNYLSSFGGPGEEDGKFRTPHGVAVDTRGKTPRVLVADRENGRIQAFDLEGNFLEVLEVRFRRPCGIAIANDGRLLVPELAGRVSLLDAQDQLIARLGDNPDQAQWANHGLPRAQWQPGLFISPHGATFDADGNLYVQDWLADGRLTRLIRQN